jgi:uncharacterized SAM-binding protein YcdF (DUF218 family)
VNKVELRFFRKIFISSLWVIFGLFFLEGLYFLWVNHLSSEVGNYDAVVVFAGSANRIEQGYELARTGVAPKLIISPANRRLIALYEKRYGSSGKATYIIEEKADTTYANAYYTTQLVKKHGLKSVLLVTSDYHMPRSYFLMKMCSFATGCRIGVYRLDTRPAGSLSWHDRSLRLKLTYNEMVQLWGSLLESGLFYLKRPDKWLKKKSSGISRWLRGLLLFDVPCPDCRWNRGNRR